MSDSTYKCKRNISPLYELVQAHEKIKWIFYALNTVDIECLVNLIKLQNVQQFMSSIILTSHIYI